MLNKVLSPVEPIRALAPEDRELMPSVYADSVATIRDLVEMGLLYEQDGVYYIVYEEEEAVSELDEYLFNDWAARIRPLREFEHG
jgi:hypothetical protein